MVFTDIWADTTKPGVTAPAADRAQVHRQRRARPTTSRPPAPVNGIINYPTHIAPLWTRDRGANTCTDCHNDPDKLDLTRAIGAPAASTSYEELMLGDPLLDPVTGLPVTRIEEGVLVIVARSGARRHDRRAKAMRSAWRARAGSSRS